MELSEVKKQTTWIQGYGAAFGKPAGELKPGDVMGWNGGSVTTVIEIIKETKKTITVIEQWADYHDQVQRSERTFKKSRIVAMVENGKFKVSTATKSQLAIA